MHSQNTGERTHYGEVVKKCNDMLSEHRTKTLSHLSDKLKDLCALIGYVTLAAVIFCFAQHLSLPPLPHHEHK